MERIEFYRCDVCGNIVALVQNGGGSPACCGQDMSRLEANTTDASKEKHVPVVTKAGGKVKAAVGSAPHPMLPEHFIQWIALAAEGRLEFAYLKPGTAPEAEFDGAESGTVYEYCNLHGLWQADF
jgi:superoxide reductase